MRMPKILAKKRWALLAAAVAVDVLAGLAMLGQSAVLARNAGGEPAAQVAEPAAQAAEEAAVPDAAAVPPVKECKPVRINYGGYGEQGCRISPQRQG
jgi:hypothetical protein